MDSDLQDKASNALWMDAWIHTRLVDNWEEVEMREKGRRSGEMRSGGGGERRARERLMDKYIERLPD